MPGFKGDRPPTHATTLLRIPRDRRGGLPTGVAAHGGWGLDGRTSHKTGSGLLGRSPAPIGTVV